MTERSRTTEPVRRRIGDDDSRRFPLPPPAPGSDEEVATVDGGGGAETVPDDISQPRRQIVTGTESRRNPTQIHTSDAGDPAGAGVAGAPGPAPGRRSIGDRLRPMPAASGLAGSTGPATSVALAEAPTHDGSQVEDQPVVGDAPRAKGSRQSKTGPRRRPSRAAALAGALIVVLLAATIFLGLQWRSQDNLNGLRSSALSSAKSDGVLLSSYDYRNLTGPGSTFAAALKNATPAFRKSFLSTSSTLDKLLTQYNATATGKVITAGVASFSSSRAVVLLFIDQTVNNSVQKSASATQPLRTQLTLLHHNGKWLIDDLQVPQ